MKFLLVDDDKLIRFSLKSMLLDIISSDCIITEASDGREMINRCIEYEPDMVFVDIRMPNLDGLSAIEECKKITPTSTFVVLSGYSDFDYARQCVKLGVSDYILKPIDLATLSSLVEKTKLHLTNLQKQKNDLFQLNLHEIFHSPHVLESVSTSLFTETSLLMTFTIFMEKHYTSTNYLESHNQLVVSLKSLSSSFLEKEILYSLDYSPEGYLYFTCRLKQGQEAYLKNKVETLCRDLANPQVTFYLFYHIHHEANSLIQNFEYMDEHSYIRLGQKPCQCVNISELSYDSDSLLFFREFSCLLDAFAESNEIIYTNHLNILYREFSSKPLPASLKTLSFYAFFTTGIHALEDNFKSFMKSFVLVSDKMYENISIKSRDKIDGIIEYVNHSYMNDISINQLASKYDLSPNYISKLFHERTQTKFIDYLTTLRMTQAKKLLISNYDAPLQDIALMVGYYSSRHFSSTFKKFTSLLPSEYRKAYSNEL